MQLKEILRKVLNPRFFYFLVDTKNLVFPNKSYRLMKVENQKSERFYRNFITKNSLVFDIGANFGNRVKIFLALKTRVVAIEPQQKCVRFIRSMYPAAVVLQKGVGAGPGELDFYISENPALSSFSTEWIEKVKDTKRFDKVGWQKPVKIPVTTIDELIKEYGTPDFIKIDVEGLEYDVLCGLSFPVQQLSFEYAVPENLGELKNCLLRLQQLGNYKVNFSKGESMTLHLPEWLDIDEFAAFAETTEFISSHAGDVYLKLQN